MLAGGIGLQVEKTMHTKIHLFAILVDAVWFGAGDSKCKQTVNKHHAFDPR
jgi:hypothetical protein